VSDPFVLLCNAFFCCLFATLLFIVCCLCSVLLYVCGVGKIRLYVLLFVHFDNIGRGVFYFIFYFECSLFLL
jgi:hypothetical protein